MTIAIKVDNDENQLFVSLCGGKSQQLMLPLDRTKYDSKIQDVK